MGNLWGHIDEGIFFTGLAIWWIVNMFRNYIRCSKDGSTYKTSVSYPTTILGRTIHVEIVFKIFVISAGIFVELITGKWRFIDENGEWRGVSHLQHISIFMLFLIHALYDLCNVYGLVMIRKFEYLTVAIAFFWYGTVFIFHSINSDLLEKVIHCIGIVLCYGCASGVMWECIAKDKFVANYFRNLMVLTVGTWYIHTPFFLFSTKGFPGNFKNPKWKRDSMKNFQFTATMLGFHLFTNMCMTLVIYALVKFCNRKNESVLKANGGFKLLRTKETDEEKGRLLEPDQEQETYYFT